MTAAHVGAGNTLFNSTTFTYDGTSHRLTNPDGSATDLVLYHLANLPSLAGLSLAATSPASYSAVDFIGYGHISGSAQMSIPPSYTGFTWGPSAKSWGNNKVDPGGVQVINLGFGPLTVFATTFTAPGTLGPGAQTSDEAQAASGDSGGGVFELNGSVWELAGLLDSIDTYPNQPASTAVYGNQTYSADLATYRSEILAIVPEPRAGALLVLGAGLGLRRRAIWMRHI